MTLLGESPRTHFTAATFAPQPAEWRGLARDDGLAHHLLVTRSNRELLPCIPLAPAHSRARSERRG